MSDPRPGHMYDPSDPSDNREGYKKYRTEKSKKKTMATKMPYLGDGGPRKGEPLSKSIKRFGRYMASGPSSSFDPTAFGKSARRNRKKNNLPF